MRHEEQVRVIRTLMDHIDRGTNVDAGVIGRVDARDYTSPERAALEWNAFFKNHPQVIGLSGDLPKAGSFITASDFGVPLLATRAADGRFRAFANVCRHRGTILENAPRGERTRFVCPFHAWTYDNTGALIGVPKAEHFGDIDKACLGLVELPAEERHGLLVRPSRRPVGPSTPPGLSRGPGSGIRDLGFRPISSTSATTPMRRR